MESVPIGILILLIFAGLILLTPGGRSLLWGRWGMVQPKDSSSRPGRRRTGIRQSQIGGPFGRRFGSFGGRRS